MTYEFTNMKKKINLVYPDLSYQLTGILFDIHNELGRFYREKQYGDLLEQRLKVSKLKYEREKKLPLDSDNKMASNKVDFCIDGKILLDLKAKKFVTKEDYYQMRRYLKVSGLKLGLIANFRNTYLKPKRVINIY